METFLSESKRKHFEIFHEYLTHKDVCFSYVFTWYVLPLNLVITRCYWQPITWSMTAHTLQPKRIELEYYCSERQ